MRNKSDKLNIAMLGQKRIPSREGGIEIVVEELSTRMVQTGHSVTCYNRLGHHISGKEFDGDSPEEYKGIKLREVFTIQRRGFAAVTSSLSGAIHAAAGRYDVVHFHAEGSCVMLWLPRLLGKRCIVTVHGLDWQRAKWKGFARRYIKLGEKMAVKYADEIIVLSESARRYFWNTYGRKTVFIPNGVNRPAVRAAERIKEVYGLDKDSYILFLGRLVPEKGIVCLIEAFRNVHTDKKLVIAGGSSDTAEFVQHLKTLAKGDKRILFTGFVQGRILEELYSNAYVYCLPSELEGMSLSLLEAMSYGNCCLVSDIAECTEVVEDKALVFKKADISDLRQKLQYVCSHGETVRKLKNQASDYICRKYNWDDVTRRTLELYQKQMK